MSSVRGRRRNRKPTKRMDMTDLRRVLTDRRVWCKLAVVVDPDEDGRHYELVEDGGALVDILVEVETVPDRLQLTCRMSGFAGGAGAGVWTIPAVGDEVIVAVPDGHIEHHPSIVAVLASRSIPNPAGQGPAPGRTIIVAHEVMVHDGAGGAVALARADHTHELPLLVEGMPNTYSPITMSGVSTGESDSNTIVLKAK